MQGPLPSPEMKTFQALLLVSVIGLMAWEGGQAMVERSTARRATTVRLEPEPISLSMPGVAHEGDRELGPCDGIYLTDTGPRPTYCRMRRAAEAEDWLRALERLDELRAQQPRLSDRWTLLRAEFLRANGAGEPACEAYRRAIDSPLRSLAAQARVGWVRCRLESGAPEAEEELLHLRWRYPRLPQALALRLLAGQAREEAGDVNGAITVYRDIDLREPGSSPARQARARLEAMTARGVEVPSLRPFQRITRLRRLARTGPLDEARREVEALGRMRLTRASRGRVALIGARIARREGRFEDARDLLVQARRQGVADDRGREQGLRQASTVRDPDHGRRTFHRLVGPGSLLRQPLGRIYLALQAAARADLTEEVDRCLEALVTRRNVPPWIAFNAARAAAGVGDDDHVAELMRRAAEHGSVTRAATYHRARALEHGDHLAEARAAYLEVIRLDDGPTPFYAFLARQRLPLVEVALRERCQGTVGEQAPFDDARCPPPLDESAWQLRVQPPPELDASPEELEVRLRALAADHGEVYPWFARAADLLALRLSDEAADELHEASLAWNDAQGRSPIRTGLESLYRGRAQPRHLASAATRAARRQLDRDDLEELASICGALGDHGLVIRFGGWGRADERPRAYEDEVRRAAARHEVDPNLLLAVMRVESVYNRRIISYAGAVGLNQIMPATGAFIARAQGREDFTQDQLLDPEVNIDFSAWYFSSLIERFDGRLPLAIAAYNGGPHNVRLWLRQHGSKAALEVFLENIPFGQTHRYVQRVLTHWEAYRAQEGLSVPPLDLTLPEVGPDRVAF